MKSIDVYRNTSPAYARKRFKCYRTVEHINEKCTVVINSSADVLKIGAEEATCENGVSRNFKMFSTIDYSIHVNYDLIGADELKDYLESVGFHVVCE